MKIKYVQLVGCAACLVAAHAIISHAETIDSVCNEPALSVAEWVCTPYQAEK